MQSKKLAKPKPGPATHKYLDIAEIRDDVVIMKDGTLRAVLLVSSINFSLKNDEEQQAIIQGYVQFLNGLEYPLQIVIQSRKMNIDGYIASLHEQEKTITNELLRTTIRDYIGFIQQLVQLGEIMQKRFYVVVPYDPSSNTAKGFFARVSEAISPALSITLKAKQFAERKHDLMQRVSLIQSGLGSMSLQSVLLDTQSLVELYYSVYNPDLAETQHLSDVREVQYET